MSTLISFHKMHGLGNDFVLIDAIRQPIHLSPVQIRFLADRHRGVGCDQVLIVEKSDDATIDFFYRIFNADGSEVGQCGNGARCLAKFVYDEKLTAKKQLRVKTITSELTLKIKEDSMIEVKMGVPSAASSFMLNDLTGTALSIGNPHVVFQVNDIKDIPINDIGQLCNQHPTFPEGVNVGFMQVIDRDRIALRVYERGVGETSACGSGACAAVVAGITKQLLNHTVAVDLPGGRLMISWEDEKSPVLMTGPATEVFHGEILV